MTLVTYKIGDNDYLLIVNAANTDKDFAWVQNMHLNLMLKYQMYLINSVS